MDKETGLFYFVIQKHHATSLHYDFRLQIGPTMPSWAIPKGPTLDPTVKRLAMQTTDHALSYRTFEGVIPQGSFGAGPVLIWDDGTFTPEKEIKKGVRSLVNEKEAAQAWLTESMNTGEIKFYLYGKRLKGSFALIKTKNFGPKNAWLLIKHKYQYCNNNFDITKIETSIVSQLTIEQIAANSKNDQR